MTIVYRPWETAWHCNECDSWFHQLFGQSCCPNCGNMKLKLRQRRWHYDEYNFWVWLNDCMLNPFVLFRLNRYSHGHWEYKDD